MQRQPRNKQGMLNEERGRPPLPGRGLSSALEAPGLGSWGQGWSRAGIPREGSFGTLVLRVGTTEGPTARPGCPFPGLAPVPGVLPPPRQRPSDMFSGWFRVGSQQQGAWREAAREARAGAGQSPPDPAGLEEPGDAVTPAGPGRGRHWAGRSLRRPGVGRGSPSARRGPGGPFPNPPAGGPLAGRVAGWGTDAGAPRSPWQVSAKASLACLEGCGCILGAKVTEYPKSAAREFSWGPRLVAGSAFSTRVCVGEYKAQA